MFQVLLIVFVALLVFRGGTLATRLIRNAKDAKNEFDRTVKPFENAKVVSPTDSAASTPSKAKEPDEVSL